VAFGNIDAFYFPIAANAGSSLWGTDVRKLLSAADATADATTITDHGTGGAVTRTVDPYSTSTADSDQTLFGWAIAPSDMGSVTGANRFFPAGNHVLTMRMGHSGATGATGTLTMYAYRVGPSPTFTRTLLGSNTASVALPIAAGEVTATLTLTLAEVVFAADETIQYALEFNVAGITITGRTVTFFTGTQTSVAARLNTPTLGVLADTTGSASGSATVTAVSGKVLGTAGTSAGAGVVAGVMSSTAATTGSAAGVATVAGQGSSVAGTTGTAAGVATVAGQTSIVLGTVGTVEIGGGVGEPVVKRPIYLFDD
jgi:hypothetical protein